ncbi:MAG: heme biosynthesis protein HemY [Rhodoferax sp.]
MRGVLWLAGLFAVAVLAALFAGNNHNSVTLFWAPYRVDLSFNLVLLLLVLGFALLHGALQALGGLLRIPQQARRWRMAQRERALYSALLEALTLLVAGRFVRSRKAAERVLAMEDAIRLGDDSALPFGTRLRCMTHLLAAESAHAVQDRSVRDRHLEQALGSCTGRDAQEALDGVRLRAARWAFDDRNAAQSLQWLEQLAQGTARRTLALRLRFKAARQGGQSALALDTARLLTKHRAFSELAGASIARGLALELVRSAHDAAQLQRAWDGLDPAEQAMPDVALEAAQRLVQLQGSTAVAQSWLLPVWRRAASAADAPDLSLPQRLHLVEVLEELFGLEQEATVTQWLQSIGQAQQRQPREALWVYLEGVACARLQLWGKAQQLLKQSSAALPAGSALQRRAWTHLGLLAEARGDEAAALQAYKAAAKT